MPGIMVVQPDGDTTRHEMPENFLSFAYEQIGCTAVDVIRLDGGVDMWIDDDGLHTQPEVNTIASLLSAALGNGFQRVKGPVILASVTPEGETIGLEPGSLLVLLMAIRQVRAVLIGQ